MQYGYTLTNPNQPLTPFCNGQIFIDRYGDTKYPAFEKMLETVEKGDNVKIPSISCLGYSFTQICDKWEQLDQKGVDVDILDLPESVTDRNLVVKLINYLSLSDQQLRKRRQMNGIANARNNGVHLGRKPLQIPPEFSSICKQYETGRLTCREAAKKLNVSHTTFLRWYRESEGTVTEGAHPAGEAAAAQ